MPTFFGTYLSASLGSLPAGETVARGLQSRGHDVRLVSRRATIPGRIAESLYVARTADIETAVLDVYSSRVLWLSEGIARTLARRRIPFVAVLRGGALLDRYDVIEGTLLPILERASRVLTPSHFLKEGFRERGFAVDRIPNALDLHKFPFRARSATRRPLRLLWVRAFTEIYRPHWAVEIVAHLRELGIDSTLTMVGPDKGLLAEAKAAAARLGVTDRVVFAGPVPNADLAPYYHDADYFLNTTQFESFGVAIAEAAAAGLPTVSAAVGEVSYLWQDGHDILLVKGASSREFAERIVEVEARDGEYYRSLSARAREKVGEFELNDVLRRWEAVLESLRKRVVFFGTFPSAQGGSRAASENIAIALAEQGRAVKLVSRRATVSGRILQSLREVSRAPMAAAVVDIYSSRVLRLSERLTRRLQKRGIPFVAVLHGGALLDRYSVIEPTLVPILKRAACIVTPSSFLQQGFRARGFDVERIPNGLDLTRFTFSERTLPRSPIRLLWVRAFADIYRPHWAVEVVAHLRRKGIDSTLTMVGPDKGLLAGTERLAASLAVADAVTFAGPVRNDQLPAVYASHDYFLNTTRFESFGMAIAESAACGLPVISAGVGEVPHLWRDGVNILLVPGESSEEFADCIVSVQRGQSRASYAELSRNGSVRAREFDLAVVARRWSGIIDDLHGRRTH